MNNILEPELFKKLKMIQLQSMMQEECGSTDYVVAVGAFIDGLNAGVSMHDMQECYMLNNDALGFERSVWEEIEKLKGEQNALAF